MLNGSVDSTAADTPQTREAVLDSGCGDWVVDHPFRAAACLFAAQIFVGLVDPVSPRWTKNIKVYSIGQRLGFVRHVGRNRQNLARVHNDFFAVDPELQRTFQDVGDLLVDVAVLGHDATLLQQDTCQHNVLADDELALEKRIQVFQLDRAPWDVPEDSWRGRLLSHTFLLKEGYPCRPGASSRPALLIHRIFGTRHISEPYFLLLAAAPEIDPFRICR